jgi:hypothetical protein
VTWGSDRTWQLCPSCSHATVKVLKHVRMLNVRRERDYSGMIFCCPTFNSILAKPTDGNIINL